MADFNSSKVDGDSVDANEWNQLASIDNFITTSGQTPSTSNLNQMGIGAARYSSGGQFFTDSGTANAYVLTSISPFKSPVSSGAGEGYFIGMEIKFRAGNANTGASTVNVNSAGVKNLKQEDGTTDLVANQISTSQDLIFRYNGTAFCLVNSLPVNYLYSPSFRNTIVNGGMQIDQRNAGAAQTITAAAALAYTVDRWYAYCTGANVTGQRVAGTTPNAFNYRFTGAASVTKIGFAQRIESANSQFLANNVATLSVNLANSLLTAVTWVAYYANSNDSFGTLASPTRTQIATGTFAVTSTLTKYSANISIPLAATTGIEIEFSVAAQTSGTFTIGRCQLELGLYATPFEQRTIQQEAALCQRYFEKSYDLDTALGDTAGTGKITTRAVGTVYDINIFFKTLKRTTPTIVVYNPITGATGSVRNESANTNLSIGAEFINTSKFNIDGAVGVSNAERVSTQYTASAEL